MESIEENSFLAPSAALFADPPRPSLESLTARSPTAQALFKVAGYAVFKALSDEGCSSCLETFVARKGDRKGENPRPVSSTGNALLAVVESLINTEGIDTASQTTSSKLRVHDHCHELVDSSSLMALATAAPSQPPLPLLSAPCVQELPRQTGETISHGLVTTAEAREVISPLDDQSETLPSTTGQAPTPAHAICSEAVESRSPAPHVETKEAPLLEGLPTFFDLIDRGGLTRPSNNFLLAATTCLLVFNRLTKSNEPSDKRMGNEFFRGANHRFTLQSILMGVIKNDEGTYGSLFAACNICESSRERVLESCIARLVNILLNNYTRKVTQQKKHQASSKVQTGDPQEKTSKNKRKLSTLAKADK